MSRKHKFHNKQGAYFVSFATVYWIDVFTRQVYFNILEESIAFQVLFESFSRIKKIRIKNDRLYILDDYGIKTFDLFGNIISQYKVENIKDLQIINQQFVYFEKNIAPDWQMKYELKDIYNMDEFVEKFDATLNEKMISGER